MNNIYKHPKEIEKEFLDIRNSIGSTKGPKGDKGDQGLPGADGLPGTDGLPGDDGVGVPTGGAAGQVLAKIDGTNYNTHWITPSGGGGTLLTYATIADMLADTPSFLPAIGYVTAMDKRYLYVGTWREIDTLALVVDRPFDPTGCVLWLDGSDTSLMTLSGGTINGIQDKSPNGTIITVPTSMNPSYVASVQNGLGAIQFLGAQKLKTNLTMANSLLSAAMVYKISDAGGTNVGALLTHNISDSGAAATYNYMILGQDGNKIKAYIGNGSAFDSAFDGPTLPYNTTRQVLFTIGSGSATARLNGAFHLSGSVPKSVSVNISLCDQGYRPFRGHLCEIILFNKVISSTVITDVENYLNAKWAVY